MLAAPSPRPWTRWSANGKQVLRTAYRITGNWADAEDVAQEVFVRLHRRDLRVQGDGVCLARPVQAQIRGDPQDPAPHRGLIWEVEPVP